MTEVYDDKIEFLPWKNSSIGLKKVKSVHYT